MVDVLGWAYVKWDTPMPGIGTLLSRLRQSGKRIAIVSNSVLPDRVYVRKYTQDGLHDSIDGYVFSYNNGVRKPDPEIVRMACDSIGVAPADCLLVGDSPSTTFPVLETPAPELRGSAGSMPPPRKDQRPTSS